MAEDIYKVTPGDAYSDLRIIAYLTRLDLDESTAYKFVAYVHKKELEFKTNITSIISDVRKSGAL